MDISDQELLNKFGDLDVLFQQADTDGDGGISGKEAAAFFPKYDVPQPVLKYLWKQCVSDPSKGVQRHEFKTAMKIIYQAKQKQSNMSQSMQPVQSEQLAPLPTQVSSNKTGEGSPFMIHPQQHQNYANYFNNISKGAPTAPGKDIVAFLQQSQVDNNFLKQVWDLCDVKKQGSLSKHYFGVAMHLVGYKKRNPNFQLPTTLPTTLLDPDSKTPTGSFNMGTTQGSFSGLLQPQPQTKMNTMSMNGMNVNGGVPIGGGGGSYDTGNMMMTSGPIQTTTKVTSLLKETNSLKDDYFQMQGQLSQAQQNLEQNKIQEQQLMQEIQTLKPQIEELRLKKQQYQQEQARIESKLLMLREDNQANQELSLQLKSEVERLEILKKNGEITVKSLTEQLENVDETIKSDTNLLESKQAEILKLKTEYDTLVQRLNDAQGTVNQTQLDQITEQVRKQQIQNEELATKLASLETKNKQTAEKYEQNKKIHEEFTQKIQSLNSQIVQIEKEIEEKSKIPNLKPKLVRLDQFHDTAVKYIKEMQNILEGLKSDNSTISPLKEDLFSKPISTTEPKKASPTVEKKATTPATNPANDFGFDDDFGHGGDSSFDSFENTSGFGKDFSIQNTKKKEEDPGPQMPNFTPKTNTTNTATTTETGSTGFDDFGFDDFGTTPTTETAPKETTKQTAPVAVGFDDFDGFGTEETKKTDAGFDSFDGFGTEQKKTDSKTGGFDDFGFDDFGNDTKKDVGFGQDGFDDGFGTTEKKEEKSNDDWGFGSDPW